MIGKSLVHFWLAICGSGAAVDRLRPQASERLPPDVWLENESAGSCPTASLDCGVVTGTTTSLPSATAPVNVFRGIQFAQSPPERFGLPQKPQSCAGSAQTTKPICLQQFLGNAAAQAATKLLFNNPGGPPPEESEDCMYLNVYAPSSPPPEGGYAVMYWIFGGTFQFGGGSYALYDGGPFAAYDDVIVVTPNYRTNVFGFPSSPELNITQRNLAFYDQRFGLDWVQRNIAAFGGNPDKVTVFGESAGAWSVDILVTSYPENPPFRAAIMQSGQYSYNAYARPDSVPAWEQLAALMDCPGSYGSNLTCLRAANATAIEEAISYNSLVFNAVADGITLVQNPMQARLDGNIAKVPTLGGTNAQEGRVFTLGVLNSTEYLTTGQLNYSVSYAEILESLYAPYTNGMGLEAYEQTSQIVTESVFQCAAAAVASANVAQGIPSWLYYFNSSFAYTQGVPGLGVYHSTEVGIVFSTYPDTGVTTQEYALSEAMRTAWARFAKNPANGPGWNAVRTGLLAQVLVGASSTAWDGTYEITSGNTASGNVNLAIFGNVNNTLSSGVTVVDSNELNYRCQVYDPVYKANAQFYGI